MRGRAIRTLKRKSYCASRPRWTRSRARLDRNREQNRRMLETGARLKLEGVIHVQSRGWARQHQQTLPREHRGPDLGQSCRTTSQPANDGRVLATSSSQGETDGTEVAQGMSCVRGENTQDIGAPEAATPQHGGVDEVPGPGARVDSREEEAERKALLIAKRCDEVFLLVRSRFKRRESVCGSWSGLVA